MAASPNLPRVVATLLVRDEADIVAATIEHHLALGVAHVIVTDNGSVDGTRDILRAYAERGAISVIDEPSLDYRQSEWVTRMARMASERFDADWVINADADEFWVPRDRRGGLPEAFATVDQDAAVVEARRSDLRGRRGVEGPWSSTLVWLDRETKWAEQSALAPKVAHRGDAGVVVAQGNHAIASGRGAGLARQRPLEILHLPLRTWSQYERKIRNGGTAYESNTELDASVGWHWRSDYERLREGTLREEYERRRLDPSEIVRFQRSHRVVCTTWLRDHLDRLVCRAVNPELLSAALEA